LDKIRSIAKRADWNAFVRSADFVIEEKKSLKGQRLTAKNDHVYQF